MQYKYALRRLKLAENKIKNDKFVESLLEGNANIFSQIKKFRGQMKTCSSRIDGEVGSGNIANHFAGIYSTIFSKVKLGEEFDQLENEIQDKIGLASLIDVFRINENVVCEALAKMKGGKSDGLYDFSSDCLTNAPPELISHLVKLLRTFMIHGTIPHFLLVCTLVPIVKDSLRDNASSDNYQAIAIGSLILKLLDWVILLLESDKLSSDQLQFGFQKCASTSMCSWAVSTVVDYFNRQGQDVFGCSMDLSKAFDMIEWVGLFRELMKKE